MFDSFHENYYSEYREATCTHGQRNRYVTAFLIVKMISATTITSYYPRNTSQNTQLLRGFSLTLIYIILLSLQSKRPQSSTSLSFELKVQSMNTIR